MRVRLHGPGGDFILIEGDNVLGRGRDCLLLVNDPRLSRHHARFVQHGAVVRVEDLGSRNGVLVNGSRITAPTALTSGDVVVCGPCRFTCDCDPHGEPAPRPIPAAPKARESTDTEPMDPVIGGPSDGRSRSRLIDGKIAAAVGTTRTGQPAAKPEAVSASVFAPDDAPEGGTSALADRPPAPSHASQPKPHQTTGVVAPHEADDHTDSALDPRQSGPPTPGQRLIAAGGDGGILLFSWILITLPLAAAGYIVALHAAGAQVVDHLPRPGGGGPGSPWGELVVSLFMPGAIDRAAEMLPYLQRLPDRSPFLALFTAGTLMVLATVLLLLLVTVAATVLHGGPLWHRRMGLEIVRAADGAYPSWTRGTIRWFLALLLAPLAPIAIALRRRSLHDLLSGCDVRRRPH